MEEVELGDVLHGIGVEVQRKPAQYWLDGKLMQGFLALSTLNLLYYDQIQLSQDSITHTWTNLERHVIRYICDLRLYL